MNVELHDLRIGSVTAVARLDPTAAFVASPAGAGGPTQAEMGLHLPPVGAEVVTQAAHDEGRTFMALEVTIDPSGMAARGAAGTMPSRRRTPRGAAGGDGDEKTAIQ